MKTAKKAPRNTLQNDPAVARVKKALADGGHPNMSAAAKSVGFEPSYFFRLVHEGLPDRPAAITVERLDKLGITDLLRNR